MLDFKLPAYILRDYERIFKEGDFLIIETYYNRYVLDKPSLPGEYAQRRIALIGMKQDLPYKLYPLSKRIEFLSQLVASKKKQLIDSTGRIVNWKPKKMYKITTAKVLSCTQIFNGKYQHFLRGVPYPFILRNPVNYISYVLFRGVPVIFGAYEEEPMPPRLRVKI